MSVWFEVARYLSAGVIVACSNHCPERRACFELFVSVPASDRRRGEIRRLPGRPDVSAAMLVGLVGSIWSFNITADPARRNVVRQEEETSTSSCTSVARCVGTSDRNTALLVLLGIHWKVGGLMAKRRGSRRVASILGNAAFAPGTHWTPAAVDLFLSAPAPVRNTGFTKTSRRGEV